MSRPLSLALAAGMLALAACATASEPGSTTVINPEGVHMQVDSDLAYPPGALSQEQLMRSTRDLMAMEAMNVFRRYPEDKTGAMVKFYTDALALRPLSPIQLTATHQMILTGVGHGQIKLSAGQLGNRKYNLAGGIKGGTGIRFFALSYPDRQVVIDRFVAAGFAAPSFTDRGDGTQAALIEDPGGFPIEVIIRPGASDGSNDGVGVGISASDLTRSRAFYREFVGLDELPAIHDPLLGLTLYPYRNGETVLYLYHAGENLPQDNGNAGIQYVVTDAPMADARAKQRGIAVETPLNRLPGFDLTTVWLNDPDGVTNYYAQIGPRKAPGSGAGSPAP